MSIVAVGNTIKLAPAAGTTANVGNVATKTTTFHILNANASTYAYVGVFPTYSAAVAMTYPGVGTTGGGVPMAPNESMTISGDFGPAQLADQGFVYVSAITASGSSSVFFTPAAPGSSG